MTQEKYMRPGLDFAVGKAIEECGELCAALGKTIRWGWDSYNPELPSSERESNRDWVLRELLDLNNALTNLENEIAKDRLSPPEHKKIANGECTSPLCGHYLRFGDPCQCGRGGQP